MVNILSAGSRWLSFPCKGSNRPLSGGSQEPSNDEISSLPMNIQTRRKEAQNMQEDLNTITARACDLIAETNIVCSQVSLATLVH